MKPTRIPGFPVLQATHCAPLGAIARPARGRQPDLCVLLAVVDGPYAVFGAAMQMTAMVEKSTGPTRCSPVVVRHTADDDQVLTLLSLPEIHDVVPDAESDRALNAYLAAGPAAELLLATCSVLWRQPASRRWWS